jgi:hypothetical protein
MWYIYNAIALDYNFPPHVVLFELSVDYQMLDFPSSHFAHVRVLLCLSITPVRISSLMERLSPKLH